MRFRGLSISDLGPENQTKITFYRFGRCDLAGSENRFCFGSPIFNVQLYSKTLLSSSRLLFGESGISHQISAVKTYEIIRVSKYIFFGCMLVSSANSAKESTSIRDSRMGSEKDNFHLISPLEIAILPIEIISFLG